jgi:hypothetical protein
MKPGSEPSKRDMQARMQPFLRLAMYLSEDLTKLTEEAALSSPKVWHQQVSANSGPLRC